MDELTLPRPDDWHLHLRDGDLLTAVTPDAARYFGRAIIMPNLVPPVVTGAQAQAYRERIMAAVPADVDFTPLMALYLTETTDPDDLEAAARDGTVTAAKLYPAGATTNSDAGVRNIDRIRPVLERMAEVGLPLCVHGEVTDSEIDIFDREAVFIERVLDPLRRAVPELRVVLEHVTTADGVDYVRANEGIGATITAHHLVLNRNHLLAGGIRPHNYCLPVVKRETHREALVQAASSGDARFFFGSDSAPHLTGDKESACGCAGCYTAPLALSLLAQVFDEAGTLDRLAGFVSHHGAAFYGLPPAKAQIVLRRRAEPLTFPETVPVTPGTDVTVFPSPIPLFWSVET